ncbi:MAG: hypothetical protein WC799_02325 [Desulfobacteraceae bacterium]|jgi:hypothetical protein
MMAKKDFISERLDKLREKYNIKPERDPLFGYEGDSLKKFIEEKPITVGDKMLIYGSQGMMHSYSLVVVEAVDSGRQKRIVVSKPAPWGGQSFYRSGINCYAPRSQSRLIPLIDWVKDQMGEGEEIIFSWNWEHII